MTLWLRVTVVCSWLLAASSPTLAESPDLGDRYLNRHRGPYRGKVVDADTKIPLAGAVVVAMWTRDRVYPLHSVNERYTAREVATDSEGRFLMDVKDVEEGAPRRTRHPEFLIFLPGYGPFPKFHRAPQGFIGGIFEGNGVTVELPRLTAREQRLAAHRAADPYNFSENPFVDLPVLVQAFNQERTLLGLQPLVRPER